MVLTPNEILNKEFNVKFRGYDAEQVNDYLDIIVADFERLITENKQLKQDLASAKEKNEYFAQLQDSLNSSIVVAQEAADRLKQNARKEAELILYEAEREADRLINQASDTAKNIVTESDALRRSSKSYRSKLEQTIRKQLELVTSEEYHRIFDEELEAKFNPEYFQEATSQSVNDRVDRLEEEYHEDDFNVSAVRAAEAVTESVEPEETEVDLGQTLVHTPLSDLGRVHEEPKEVTDELDEVAEEELVMTREEARQERAKERRESVLGQTIRIELPKD